MKMAPALRVIKAIDARMLYHRGIELYFSEKSSTRALECMKMSSNPVKEFVCAIQKRDRSNRHLSLEDFNKFGIRNFGEFNFNKNLDQYDFYKVEHDD